MSCMSEDLPEVGRPSQAPFNAYWRKAARMLSLRLSNGSKKQLESSHTTLPSKIQSKPMKKVILCVISDGRLDQGSCLLDVTEGLPLVQ